MLSTPESSTGRPWVDAGRLCIDFVMTGPSADMAQSAAAHERFARPSDLASWLRACELGVEAVRPDARALRRAMSLRDSLWRMTVAAAHGAPAPLTEIEVVNDLAARTPLAPRLHRGRQVWHRPSVSQALATVARDAVALHGHPGQLARLRECASDDCPRVFYDASRAAVRRWCDPVRCGDRQRARTYRAHRRDD